MRGALLSCALVVLAGCGGAPTSAPLGDEDEAGGEAGPDTYAVALRLEEADPTEDESPRTRVALVRIAPGGERTLEELRVELGACWHEEQAAADHALVSARCWWAGAGARYLVTRQGDAVVAHRQELDELADDGPWEEAGRVALPEDAVLQVLAPGRRAVVPGER
ncbi:MAG: hypothetical protein KF729_35725 [Sandaracinaceae bacterium]|nr:hypothetical protein [Sandaracinaceae bacterium]